MKNSPFSTIKSLTAMAMIALSIFASSCKEDEVVVFPVPTVSPVGSLSGLPGTMVTLKASINAPAGLKTVTVLKNGAAFDSKSYAGETAIEYSKEYTIENIGTPVNFTIIAIDKENQASELVLLPVAITAIPPKTIVEVKGTLEGNISWTADKIYKLVGFVRVGEDLTAAGAPTKTGVLTIAPGTVIIGDRATKGTLIIQRGSKIIAEGTVDKPIIMTSERSIGEREPGDWGGLVICGNGVINVPAGVNEAEGKYGAFYGGKNDADDSGSLKYVRVEYAGIPINPNEEVNSFTFGAVGSTTKMEYLQASYGLDDSFEWFGGTANAKYLIAYRGLDDDFDTDFGFRGNVQYAIGMRSPTQADQSGSNGFESDNAGASASATSVPKTAPIFANVSLIGAKGSAATSISTLFQNGIQIRRNSSLSLYNSLITGYPTGIYLDNQAPGTIANAEKGDLVLKNIVLAGVDGWGTNGYGLGAATLPRGAAVSDKEQNTAATEIKISDMTPTDWFKSIVGNKLIANTSKTGLNTNLWVAGRPTFVLAAGTEESLIGTALPTTLPAFFDKTDFIGAFKSTDWTLTWAEFSPQSVVYIK
ncbi:MAG: Ig-like domain repeat protein [Bacteroidota bacterium]